MRLILFMVHNKFKKYLGDRILYRVPSLGSEAVQECS